MTINHHFIRSGLIAASLLLIGAGCTIQQPPSSDNSASVQPRSTENILDRSNQGIREFPMEILNQTQLQELNLSHNRLQGAMPAEIRRLGNLRRINISYNQFTGLPAELGQLEKLEELDVSYNMLTGLPYELGNLKNLKRLILTGNSYSQQDLAVILKSAPQIEVIR